MCANSDMGGIHAGQGTGKSIHTYAARADLRRITTFLCAFTLASCAHVPVFDETLAGTHSQAEIENHGSAGPALEETVESRFEQTRGSGARCRGAGATPRTRAGGGRKPLFAGNQVTILRDGAQTFPAMFAAIHAARHYCIWSTTSSRT